MENIEYLLIFFVIIFINAYFSKNPGELEKIYTGVYGKDIMSVLIVADLIASGFLIKFIIDL